MKISTFLLVLLAFTTHVTAELPGQPEKLGRFVTIEDRDARLIVATNGKIELRGMRDRKSQDNDVFDIVPTIQTRDKDKAGGRWTWRKLDRQSLQATGKPAVNPDEVIGFKAKVTTGIEYQVELKPGRRRVEISAWLTSLGEKADEQDVKLSLRMEMADLFYYLKNKEEVEIRRKTRRSRLRLRRLDGRRVTLDFDESVDLEEEGLEKGFVEIELNTDRTGNMRKLSVASPAPKKQPLQFFDFKGGPILHGFEFGHQFPENTTGRDTARTLVIEWR